jgi:erythromycin esterase
MNPLLFASLAVPVALVWAGTIESALGQDANDWIRSQAIRLRTFEPDQQGFGDLAPLKAVIGNARVVMLGEQAHAEGATFLGKTRIIQFLHEEMDFDVLCFESGLFDCEAAWRSIRSGTDAWTAMSTGIFPIWMQAAELAPLTDAMDRWAKTDRPLELCGYDCQLTGSASRDHLLGEIVGLNARGTPPALDEAGVKAVSEYVAALLKGSAPDAASRASGEATLAALSQALSGEAYAKVPAADRSFWKQLLKSLPAFTTMLGNSARKDLPLPEQFNPRDEQGGDTLTWLVRERYPNRKIIVWAASMHCVRSPDGITPLIPGLSYAGVHTMGHVAAAALGDDVFVLSFVSGAGQAGNVFGRSWQVPEPPSESLEARCRDLELGACIIPLRSAAEGTFGAGEFLARPLGNAPMRATWRKHVDAFAYTPVMVPATVRRSRSETPPANNGANESKQ